MLTVTLTVKLTVKLTLKLTLKWTLLKLGVTKQMMVSEIQLSIVIVILSEIQLSIMIVILIVMLLVVNHRHNRLYHPPLSLADLPPLTGVTPEKETGTDIWLSLSIHRFYQSGITH